MPKRLQAQHIGWRMPDSAVFVGASSDFDTPYKVGRHYNPIGLDFRIKSRHEAVTLFHHWLRHSAQQDASLLRARAKRELRGKDLVCTCPLNQPCHADTLLEIANSNKTGREAIP